MPKHSSQPETSTKQPSVAALLASRLRGESDHYKLGLAVEGGGMRGVVSGGMLIALSELGAQELFDGFYGTSSGSMNLAYYLSGQTWAALSVYYDHLVDKRFVSMSHLIHGKPLMDMDFLFDEVMGRRIPINYDSVLNCGKSLTLGLTNVDLRKAESVSKFENGDDLRLALRAGATLPIVAGGPAVYKGTRYLDGGALYPAPFYVALEDGCTHVLSLGTRPWATQKSTLSAWQYVLAAQLDRWSPGLGRTYKQINLASYVDRAQLRQDSQDLRGAEVLWLRPDAGAHGVTRLTRDRAVLLDGARAGFASIHRLLSPESAPPFYFGIVAASTQHT